MTFKEFPDEFQNYRKFFQLFALATSAIVVQHIATLGFLFFLVYSIFSIVELSKNRAEHLLIIICCSGFLDGSLVNLATMRIFGGSVLYIYIVVAGFVCFIKHGLRVGFLISLYIVGAFLYLIASLLSNELSSYFITDIVIHFLPILFFIIFGKSKYENIILTFFAIAYARLSVSGVLYTFEIGVEKMNSHILDYQVRNFDELNIFYVSISLALLFHRNFDGNLARIYLILVTFSLLTFGINSIGLGSQSIIIWGIVFTISLGAHLLRVASSPEKLLKMVSTLILIFSAAYFFILSFHSEYLLYKWQNISGLFGNLNNIENVPYSVQVRLIEIANLLDRHILTQLFGSGLGSYFTETSYKFTYLGIDAFSAYELESRNFYNPHNVAYSLLKTGLFIPCICCLAATTFFMRFKGQISIEVFVTFLILALLNFGYGYKYCLILSLLLLWSEKNLGKFSKE